jgi:uncharacterized membrane protein YkvA (DUF1232 family)
MIEDRITIELNPREKRLYERMRSRMGTLEPGTPSGVRDLVLLLPDLTVLLVRLLRDPRVPRGSKLVALLGVGYVLSPIDLLLVVTAALAHLLDDVHPDVVRSHWPGKGDALEVVQRVTQWSRALIRQQVDSLVRRLRRRSA